MMETIAIVDIETTGFQNRGGLIVEVGIVLLDLRTGEVTPVYDELVKEDGFGEAHRDSWIFKNSDLKHEDVMKAKPLDVQAIQNIFDKFRATAYNKRFDFDFLMSRGLKPAELCCPMVLATNLCCLPSPVGYSFKWPSVQEAWDILIKKEYVEKHRGLDDAKHEALIVYDLYKRGVFPL